MGIFSPVGPVDRPKRRRNHSAEELTRPVLGDPPARQKLRSKWRHHDDGVPMATKKYLVRIPVGVPCCMAGGFCGDFCYSGFVDLSLAKTTIFPPTTPRPQISAAYLPSVTATALNSYIHARWSIALEAPVFNGFLLPCLTCAAEMPP